MVDEKEKNLIVGVHSIASAIKNNERSNFELFATEDGLDELIKRGELTKKDLQEKTSLKLLAPHKLQEVASDYHKDLGLNYKRIPSGVFLLCDELEAKNISWIYDQIECGKLKKIICLDGVTDTHNAAAILRTASFYGVDCMLISVKGNFGNTPSFFRIASGATEHIPLISCASLPKAIKKLQSLGVICLGLSEHSTGDASKILKDSCLCMILGSEDYGLSNAVMRVVENTVSIKSQGDIKSLNVSVAAAVFMEKYF